MLKNTEPRTWRGVWYLPESDDRHPGILEYKPESGICLELFSKGFDVPREVDTSEAKNTESVRVVESIPQPNDVKNYPVIFGETEGGKITIFGLTKVFDEESVGGQVQYVRTKYQSNSMLVFAHTIYENDEIFGNIRVAIDFLHLWLPGTGSLKVSRGFSYSDSAKGIVEVRESEKITGLDEIELSDDIFLKFSHCGFLPSLKHPAYGYVAHASTTSFAEFKKKDELFSIDSIIPEISALEALGSILLDVRCHSFAYKGLVKTDEGMQDVDILIPRRGGIPTMSTTDPRGDFLQGATIMRK